MNDQPDNQSRDRQLEALLIPAYRNASKLKLKATERRKLMKPFPGDAFEIRPDGIVFIPHIFLSSRLNQVFNPGEWMLVCRKHWEDENSRSVRAEYTLIIRGCAIGEAMGEHFFDAMSGKYGDALESTRAEALRRICAKTLSCGEQIWQPAFVKSWKKKNAETYIASDLKEYWRPKGSTETIDSEAKRPTERGGGKAQAEKRQALKPADVDNARHIMLQMLCSECGNKNVENFAILKGFIEPGQKLDDWKPAAIAVEEWQIKKLTQEIKDETAKNAKPPHWSNVVCPMGRHKGKKLKDLSLPTLQELHKHYTEEAVNDSETFRTVRRALDEAAKDHKLDTKPAKTAEDKRGKK